MAQPGDFIRSLNTDNRGIVTEVDGDIVTVMYLCEFGMESMSYRIQEITGASGWMQCAEIIPCPELKR